VSDLCPRHPSADHTLEDQDLGGELLPVLEDVGSEQLASVTEELIQSRRRRVPAARWGC
jgi:hypothetical protein